MPIMTNYKPEDITTSMRKYLGIPDVEAQDEGTSEGAKKGWETRRHGSYGVEHTNKLFSELGVVKRSPDDEVQINKIESKIPEWKKKIEGLKNQLSASLTNPQYHSGQYNDDKFDREDMTDFERTKLDGHWRDAISKQIHKLDKLGKSLDDIPGIMRDYGVDGFFRTVDKIDNPWIPSKESEWVKNNGGSDLTFAQELIAAELGYEENPGNAIINGKATKGYRRSEEYPQGVYAVNNSQIRMRKPEESRIFSGLTPNSGMLNGNSLYSDVKYRTKEDVAIAQKTGLPKELIGPARNLYYSNKRFSSNVGNFADAESHKNSVENSTNAVQAMGGKYIPPVTAYNGRNYHLRDGAIVFKGKKYPLSMFDRGMENLRAQYWRAK